MEHEQQVVLLCWCGGTWTKGSIVGVGAVEQEQMVVLLGVEGSVAEQKLRSEVEAVTGFTYPHDRVSAGGECKAAVTV